MVLLTLFLPLISFALSIIISYRYAWIVSISAPLFLLASAVCATIALFSQWNAPDVLMKFNWFTLGKDVFSADLLISNLVLLMLFVVALISFLVHLYSVGYMAGDKNIKRYFAMLGFFTFSMQGIVLSDSLLVLFVFWELVGFSSYLLIGHYSESINAGRASKKAFILNRIGDIGFLVCLMLVWSNQHSFNIIEIVGGEPSEWKTYASLCLFFGVVGKSAQFPLFTWLPDAMEGPTPVSALMHAATMVAAGVYLVIKVFPFFTPVTLEVITIIGLVTALIGGFSALAQFDIKKILAYSTISQLGLMLIGAGASMPEAALLHLLTHAFFKACLFLGAGAVIHSLHQAQRQAHAHFDAQDIRCMGGLSKKLRWTFATFVVSGASLAGIPFFSGFLSKEALLTSVWMQQGYFSAIVFLGFAIVSVLTVLYTYRLVYFVFLGESRMVKELPVTEIPLIMRIPLTILAVGSFWFVVSWSPFDFSGWLFEYSKTRAPIELTIGSSVIILVTLFFSTKIYRSGVAHTSDVLRNGFYVDSFYNKVSLYALTPIYRATLFLDRKVIDGGIHFSVYAQVTFAHVVAWVDRQIVDGLVHLVAGVASGIGSLIRSFQGGKIQHYVYWAVFAIIIFLICVLK
ncbi:NADH-quinone oxidoreductase subunit 5 family protein [Chryseosolibacter indicus]|uniref:NADH-quinone oxidoreductase subunit 5 family protein n=1 Tax=Chryseosolibacter indicus TaxID=2782351 RepID=UPI0020B1C95F